ncbi:MAG: hypothetical protein M9894_14360 [Planctomycetes bacterium]|nr:hypothetical protein [Planctomycetota bacterium]
MSEAPRIKVEGRARPVCPYCKDEVAGGHVWLCPGCAAAHHADCLAGHGACATCGLAPAADAPADGSTEAPPRTPSRAVDEPLRAVAAAVVALGFSVVREADDHLALFHPAWWAWGRDPGRPLLVFLVRVDRLGRSQASAHVRRLARDPLTRTDATVLFVADALEADAEAWLRTGASASRHTIQAATPRQLAGVAERRVCVPMAWWVGQKFVSPEGVLGPAFPAHEDPARRAVMSLASGRPADVAAPRPAPPLEGASAPGPTELVWSLLPTLAVVGGLVVAALLLGLVFAALDGLAGGR